MKLSKQRYRRLDLNRFAGTQIADDLHDAIVNRHLTYFKNHQLVLSQQVIDYAFYLCCYLDLDFSFTQKIIELGVEDFVTGCVNGCCMRQNYGLLYNILYHYGQSHQIQLLQHPDFSINNNVCRWISETFSNRGERQRTMESNLFKLFIALIPNHTQKVNHSDKYYELIDIKHYDYYLNMILKAMLKTTYEIGKEAFAVLAEKKFPLYQENIQNLKEKGYEYSALFARRLNPKSQLVNEYYDAIGSHQLLNRKKIEYVYSDIVKTRIFYHLQMALNIPESISTAIKAGIRNRNKQNQEQKIWPSDMQYAWFCTLKSKHLPFFERYFDYGKMKLYYGLDAQLVSQGNVYEQRDEAQSHQKIGMHKI
jgi:hypothetical protein